ncbi:helix-turn-helix domain-containing protein [Rhizobium sp. BK176]|uniref:helix-turn-helix domain-containing protein n=1 Tax=Rhizobium sp. BK176 TaxID=2587071 RepID=UPI002167F1F4|nr:helix-turn-helix transcriptional regulator [Rhizobium sp. BK176]
MDAKHLVAWNIRRLRVLKGISQDDLALSAGIERSYAGHLERGTKNPTIVTLEKIAGALSCELLELFVPMPKNSEPLLPLKSGRRSKT